MKRKCRKNSARQIYGVCKWDANAVSRVILSFEAAIGGG